MTTVDITDNSAEVRAVMGQSKDFLKLLEYINTSADAQKKGTMGGKK